jgi:hypothetical protein
MGTKRDTNRRQKTRVDDEIRQRKVEMSRHWIFDKGLTINGKAVERIIQQESYVPTRVSYF